MLIDFRVSNYRSIADEQALSLVPEKKQRDHLGNIYEHGKYEVLNAIGIYGANASGKSNLLRAMKVMDTMLTTSASGSSLKALPYEPFRLREGMTDHPTTFEITFLLNESKYRYGFSYTNKAIKAEWLFRKKTGRESTLFQREDDIIDCTSALQGKQALINAAIEATRENALFLSFCDTFNIEEARAIFQWFNKFHVIDGLTTEDQALTTIVMYESDQDLSQAIDAYLSRAKNLGIEGISINKRAFDPNELPTTLDANARELITTQLSGKTNVTVLAAHSVLSKDGKKTGEVISWSMDDHESAGTNKIFHLIGPVIHTLKYGGVLVIDEIEAKMHPLLTLDLINMFLKEETNPKHAQLIFATHDTNLLSYAPLRRDQIYFTNKTQFNSTELYSLSDFKYLEKAERPDADKEKRYLEGRYEAVPFFDGALSNLFITK